MVKIDLKKTAGIMGLYLPVSDHRPFYVLVVASFFVFGCFFGRYICDNLKVVANRTIGFNQRQSIPVRFIFTVYYSFVITLVGTFI